MHMEMMYMLCTRTCYLQQQCHPDLYFALMICLRDGRSFHLAASDRPSQILHIWPLDLRFEVAWYLQAMV
jgi:hypothetical protein